MGVVAYLMTSASRTPPVHVMTGKPFATISITNLTANLFTSEGHLGPSQNDVFIEFRDSAGKLVNVGDVRFELRLTGADAVLHNLFKVLPTSTPGQYRVMVQPQIVGDWQAKLTVTSPTFNAETAFPITVR